MPPKGARPDAAQGPPHRPLQLHCEPHEQRAHRDRPGHPQQTKHKHANKYT